MKTSHLFNIILAIALVIMSIKYVASSNSNKSQDESDDSTEQVTATSDELKPFDFKKELTGNPFYFIDHFHPALLMAGDKAASNAMTIGWGATGQIWGNDRPSITVYVAQNRYTHQLMEKSKYFTVMKIDGKVLEYMGTHSGHDGDKGKALGLHVAYTPHGAPYYKEATEVYECEIMYAQQFIRDGFRNDVTQKLYADFPPGIHSMYIGEVTGAWKK